MLGFPPFQKPVRVCRRVRSLRRSNRTDTIMNTVGPLGRFDNLKGFEHPVSLRQ
jgi:hypothetical protein